MTDSSPQTQIIPLARMPQQASVRKATEDWTGIINRQERRKLQNRLNQRRYRTYYIFRPKNGIFQCLIACQGRGNKIMERDRRISSPQIILPFHRTWTYFRLKSRRKVVKTSIAQRLLRMPGNSVNGLRQKHTKAISTARPTQIILSLLVD